MRAPTCPYCNLPSVLTDSSVIYGRSYGPIYLCGPCKAYVGCHKGTTEPLGRLADAELREWKKRAHSAFDPIWQGAVALAIAANGGPKRGLKHKARSGAYARLAAALSIPFADCHIGMFDVDKCKAVVQVCSAWTEEQPEKISH